MPPPGEENDGNDGNRKFIARRYNMLGNLKSTEFTLSNASKNVVNPFASFMVKPGGYFYIFGGLVEDPVIRSSLTRETDFNVKKDLI
jgi:hypothetical protein